MRHIPEEIAAIDQAAARINTETAAIRDLAEKRREDARSSANLRTVLSGGRFGNAPKDPDAAAAKYTQCVRQQELAAAAIAEAERIRDASSRLKALVREMRRQASAGAWPDPRRG